MSEKHPQSKKKITRRFTSKGRSPSAEAVEQLEKLFQLNQINNQINNQTNGGTNNLTNFRQRDLLIEHLHVINDKFNCLDKSLLLALAKLMNLPYAEVFEVASFYSHFKITENPNLQEISVVRVCNSISCQLKQSNLLQELQQNEQINKIVRIEYAPCMGQCDHAPVAMVGKNTIQRANNQKISLAVQNKEFHVTAAKNELSKQSEVNEPHYKIYKNLKNKQITAQEITAIIEQSGLRGCGGAGFPTAKKWQFVNAENKPRYLVVNADEGEPGTFKDKMYLENHPHEFLEGMLITQEIIQAEKCFIYLRDEYPKAYKIISLAINNLVQKNIASPNQITLRRGAGAYICGEESALIESLEGKKGLPRHRPPYVAQVGLFNRPTLVQNVETLFWVQKLCEKGPELFTSQGRRQRQGLRSISLSGRIKNPGVKIVPAGISAVELINEFGGGMLDNHSFKGYLPGGASGGMLPASLGNVPIDFDTLQKFGCFIGSGAVVIFSNHDNMFDVTLNLMEFFKHESCGQCPPCRLGTMHAVELIKKRETNKKLYDDLNEVMAKASICGLGQAAPNPIICMFKYFPQDIPN